MKTVRINQSFGSFFALIAVMCVPLCFSGCTPETGQAVRTDGPAIKAADAPPKSNKLPPPPVLVVPPGEK